MDGREVRLMGRRLSHRVHAASKRGAQLQKCGLGEEVAVLVAVQDRELVPDEGNRGERGAKNVLAGVGVQAAVDAELVLDGVVHRADAGDGLAHLIAEAVRLSEKLDWTERGLRQAEEAGRATKDNGERGAHGCDGADGP